MQTRDLVLDIYFWMEFNDEEDLLAELRDCDTDEWPRYREFTEMMVRCMEKLKEKNDVKLP